MSGRFTIPEQLERMPFLRMLIPLMAGILLSESLNFTSVTLLTVLAALIVGFFLFRGERLRQVLLVAMLLITGISAEKVLTPRETMPRNERLLVSGTIEDNINTYGRWHRSTLQIDAFRLHDDSITGWQPCDERIALYVDTVYTVALGNRICAVAYINPFDTLGGTTGYARTMRSRGVLGRAFVINGRLISCREATPEGFWASVFALSKQVQGAIDQRLARFGMDDQELGVAMALLSGDRALLDPELKEDYSKAGVSHILAISGLHLGIIFLLLNYLFTPLLLLRRGRLWRTALVILALWGYAFVSGLSASVLRSAFMLTIMQFSLFTVWNNNSYNALFASAFVLLLIRPTFLYDISFQMSYLALLGILFFYPRFNRWTGVERASAYLRRRRNRTKGVLRLPVAFVCNLFVFMTGAILIGLSAQLTVMPLTGWAFGRLPLLSVLFNPLIMLVITWLMVAGFAYLILAGVPGLGWLAGAIMKWLLERQNAWVEWIAGVPGVSVERVSYSLAGMFAVYFLLLLAMIGIKYFEACRHQSEPADAQPFA
jgi:competence protein ComEC